VAARRVVLCADDFAQTLATVDGIVALVGAGRLSAVGCLVESPLWPAAAPRLAAVATDRCDIGLHFNLTQDVARGVHRATALPLTIAAACLRLLSWERIAVALQRQLDLFEREMRRAPDFVDGHQHVHQLPGAREALVAVPRGVKAAAIARLGGRGLRQRLVAAGIPHNADFAGVYGLSAAADFPALLRGWLAGVRDRALVMCHPASPGAAGGPGGDPIADPIQTAREREHAYLASDAFAADLARAGVRLARFRDLAGPA